MPYSRVWRVAGIVALSVSVSVGQEMRESFDSLAAWEPLTFPKIEKQSQYQVVEMDGDRVLKANADASASGLVRKESFNPYDTPILRFRWRAENVLEKGNAMRKDGDDYPIRIYVFFPYDPDQADWRMRAKYGLAKRIFGEYPPHSGLNYIWANRRHEKRILESPYTDRSRMIILQAGKDRLGAWIKEEVNILEDYREAFGEDSPPQEAQLAIMSDADNTGGKAVAYVDWIELRTAE